MHSHTQIWRQDGPNVKPDRGPSGRPALAVRFNLSAPPQGLDLAEVVLLSLALNIEAVTAGQGSDLAYALAERLGQPQFKTCGPGARAAPLASWRTTPRRPASDFGRRVWGLPGLAAFSRHPPAGARLAASVVLA